MIAEGADGANDDAVRDALRAGAPILPPGPKDKSKSAQMRATFSAEAREQARAYRAAQLAKQNRPRPAAEKRHYDAVATIHPGMFGFSPRSDCVGMRCGRGQQ